MIDFKGVRNNLLEISVIYNDISIYFGDVIVVIQYFVLRVHSHDDISVDVIC